MKSCATRPIMRFLTVMIPTGNGGVGEDLYKRAMAIREQILGPSHPEMARTLNNLARLYRAQGRSDEADRLEKRARDISSR